MTVPAPTLDRLVATFAKRAGAHDASGEICTANLADLREAGLLALTVRPEFGGAGAGLREVTKVIAAIAKGDPSTALIVSMQYLQHAGAAASPWPEATLKLVSEEAVKSGALINALRVEPALGTPARGGVPATTLSREETGWRLNGSKIYSTGSIALRWGLVWAATNEEAPRIGYVLVPLDQEGVSIDASWNHLGMRATGSHTVTFSNVPIADDHVVDMRLPADWKGHGDDLMAWHGVLIAALYDGVARAARDWFLSFLKDRVPANLGQPLASLPRFHEIAGEIEALLLSNEALIEHQITQQERREANATQANLVKQIVTENAIKAVERAVSAIGNPALSRDNPLERHYRNVLCARIHTPQADIALSAAGRAALTEEFSA
ncbi:acyl-CoA dehydrogenase family protein [Asaia astilbis]|uniref:acyl-CoA dehydrogenase family protein n=1 Tax=Asaia astilbis TaxID=610244 RepID=UPI00046FF000|nr:acyl-CoA dehydrogenase family protein [Asaia astilbis]